jgi:protein gp37
MAVRIQATGNPAYRGTTEMLVAIGAGKRVWRDDWETFPKAKRWGKARWSGKFREVPGKLDLPLRWKKPRTIFVNSMSDLFGEGVSFEFIAAVFAVMAATAKDAKGRPWHRYQILTKRPDRIRAFFAWLVRDAKAYDSWPLENVMLGVSAENQATWDERVPTVRGLKEAGHAARIFVSVEPMLERIDPRNELALLDMVIIGCESRGKALGRPTRIEWVQSLVQAVLAAKTVCKRCGGLGGWSPGDPPQYQECHDCLGAGRAGPALFVKQWPVCQDCYGEGQISHAWDDVCTRCGGSYPDVMNTDGTTTTTRKKGTGQDGKLHKTPKVWIPGHVAQSWTQQPVGW